MLILAADTSTNAGSLALAESTDAAFRVLVERSWDLAGGANGKRRAGAPNHSDRIVPEIEEMLHASGVAHGDLGGLACAIGPGSFTGLRVALSALKGIALARDLPLAGVSTLEALAWNAPHSARIVVPMLDAKKSEVYGAAFAFDASGALGRLLPDSVSAPETFLATVAALARPAVLVGDGAAPYAARIAEFLGDRAAVLDGSANLPHAGNVARLAVAALRAGRSPATDAAAIVPAYIRRPEAEWKRMEIPKSSG